MALINTTTTGVLGSTFYGDGTGSLTIQENGVTINQISSSGLLYGKLTSMTAQTSTSGTSINFTDIPSWVKRVTVMFDQVSTNGTSIMQIQLGTSSGIQTTSYSSVHSYNGPTNGGAAITTGFGIFHNLAGDIKTGLATFSLLNNNTWVAFGGFANSGSQPGYIMFTSGSKSLGATLDRLRITTVNGTDTFDSGTINLLYE